MIEPATTCAVARSNSSAVMDALAEGGLTGRRRKNLHRTKWEQQLDRSLDDIRADDSAPAVV